MFPASLVFTWVAWRQHRWGLLLVLCGLFLAGTLATLVPRLYARDQAEFIFAIIVLPLLSLTVYPLVVFTYGFDAGDMFARESCFPTGLLRLPLRTGGLVLWPMLVGAAATFLLWLATSFFIIRPLLLLWNVEMPLWWPSMLAVAFLAWLQALLWVPFSLPGFRAILLLILVECMRSIGFLGVWYGVSESSLVGVFAFLTLVAWGVGYVGVRRARHGAAPNWEWNFAWPISFFRGAPSNRPPFKSASLAQKWFEWRVNGKMLPILTGLMLPIAFLPHFFNPHGAPWFSLVCTLTIPVFFAGVAGWLGSRRGLWEQGRTGMMPFLTTLPMSTADMVGAKFKTAAWTSLTTWGLIALSWSLALVLTVDPAALWRHDLSGLILFRIAAGSATFALVLFVWTWKHTLDYLYVGMIGSKWVEATVAFGSIPVTYFLCFFVVSIYDQPQSHNAITLTLWPWLLGTLVTVRLLTAAWALREALRQGLLQPRTVACWVAVWLLLASLLFALLLGWAKPLDVVPMHHLALGVLFALPMIRIAAAPLVLAYSRHR